MENLRKKLKIIDCEYLLETIKGTTIKNILHSIKEKTVANREESTTHDTLNQDESNTVEDFGTTPIYKMLVFYRNIDLESKQLFKRIEIKTVCDFFTTNPKFDTFFEKFIYNLGKDPLIYSKTNTDIFFVLLIVLNYLETNNKRSLAIENQIKTFKMTAPFLNELKPFKNLYFFNLFSSEIYNKSLLYLQPVYTVEMEVLFLNYFYVSRVSINYEFFDRLSEIMLNFQKVAFKENQFGKNFLNHRLSINDSYIKMKKTFFNKTISEKALLILRIIFFLGSPLFESLDDVDLIKTTINVINTFHKKEKRFLNKIYDFIVELFTKTNNKVILQTVINSDLVQRFSKNQQNNIKLKNCKKCEEFKDLFNKNLNDYMFYKMYLNEVEAFFKKDFCNDSIENSERNLELLLSFFEHIKFVIQKASPYYLLQTKKQLFVLLGDFTKKFLNTYPSIVSNNDRIFEKNTVYERYKEYSFCISTFLKGIEKNIAVLSRDKPKLPKQVDKTIPSFLMIMREFEDYLNTYIFLNEMNSDYRINRRGFVLE
ncbi:hypothetical protein CDIK_1144 [Cucumispora dikerogammari]|nr:hypothetical protein CDIK_1144 [Cucumispora dikerogammari]